MEKVIKKEVFTFEEFYAVDSISKLDWDETKL